MKGNILKEKLLSIINLSKKIVLLLIILTIVLLIYSLGYENANSIIKYFSYAFSTYTLIITIIVIPSTYKKIKQSIKSNKKYKELVYKLKQNKYIKNYIENIAYRNIINLSISATINSVFIILKFIDGVKYQSVWFISLSIYYMSITIIKSYLVTKIKDKENIKNEYRIYKKIGYLMLILNIIIIVMIIQMIRKNVAIVYDDYVVYLTATYTFYLIISAIVNLVKYRKYNSPILSSIKTINLFTALVSILMLQTTMIATFGSNLNFMKLMNTITGTGISVIVSVISIYMIIKSTKNSKK